MFQLINGNCTRLRCTENNILFITFEQIIFITLEIAVAETSINVYLKNSLKKIALQQKYLHQNAIASDQENFIKLLSGMDICL